MEMQLAVPRLAAAGLQLRPPTTLQRSAAASAHQPATTAAGPQPKMVLHTCCAGFCVELSVAAVIIVASRYGLPMSSTPATVGAIAGVGLLEGRGGFNFRLFLKFCGGWVFTIVATVGMSCAFMAQGLYSPNKSW